MNSFEDKSCCYQHRVRSLNELIGESVGKTHWRRFTWTRTYTTLTDYVEQEVEGSKLLETEVKTSRGRSDGR